jgi:hypothetical protein
MDTAPPSLGPPPPSPQCPRIIHFIYFPWDQNHVLKPDENDFDHAPVETMRQYAPNFDVRLWTFSKAREFCQLHDPSVWQALETCPHPVMRVDVLRWVVVHHFGGIYWQMNATPLRPMEDFLPSPNKGVRLFTEFVLSPEKCQAMAAEPIRNGQPEEPARVLIQAFASRPAQPFLDKAIDFLLGRVKTHVPNRDYDILYITGNAAISTAYDAFGKDDPAVELVGLAASKSMLKWHYQGSWRRDAAAPTSSTPVYTPLPSPRLDRMPLLGSAIYRFARHPHEAMLAVRDAYTPRTSFLPHVAPLIEKLAIRTIFEAPCGICMSVPPGITYVGGDPNRAVVAANRRRTLPNARFRHVNMLYSNFPQVDLFICPDFFEWLPFAEIRRVLRRIARSKPKYLALTSCPLLTESWDTALGDYRPVHFLPPLLVLPSPPISIQLPPLPSARPDTTLAVWDLLPIRNNLMDTT